jgi:DNA polymerase-3 subunit epsilon
VLDAVILDRHFDRERKGRRTLGDLCEHYGVDIGNAHDATADALASVKVLIALGVFKKELREGDLAALHAAQVEWHQEWALAMDDWRKSQGMLPIDPRDYVWPVAPSAIPAA